MGKNNLTHDGNKEMLYADLFCLPESTAGIKNQLIFLAALNIFLSITALLGNSLILAVLRKESSLHPPSKIMFRNLAIPDFCAGIIAEPVIAICWLSVVNKRWDICRFALIATHITGYILGYHKCGQASGTVAGAKVPTSCNFEADRSNNSNFLGCVYC